MLSSNKTLIAKIPTIELPLLPTTPTSSTAQEEEQDLFKKNNGDLISTLRNACQTYGFFYLQIPPNHPLLLSSSDHKDDGIKLKVFQQSKLFFQSLPSSLKEQYTNSVTNRGYTGMEEETLDPKRQMNRGDTKEGYYVGFDVSKEYDNSLYNVDKLSVENVWPENYYNDSSTRELILDAKVWKQTMMDYHTLMCSIGFQTVQLLALAIGLDDLHYFDPYFTLAVPPPLSDDIDNHNNEEEQQQEELKYQNPMALLRLLHYSNEKSIPSEGIYACGAHSDYGMITLLATDDNPGLQVLIDKQYVTSEEVDQGGEEEYVWMDVPPPTTPNTFIVNLGDMMERWTNGMFKSTKHRVLIQAPSQQQQQQSSSSSVASGGDGDRYSIPFFYEPKFDTLVECLDICNHHDKDNEKGSKYPPTTAGLHLLSKYKETHADFTPTDE